jgi:gentisate 1,2-dioxygenase
VWQVFEGEGTVVDRETEHRVRTGDLFAVPSWVPWSLHADTSFDLFRFNDGPIIDRLRFTRTYVPGRRNEDLA